MCLAGVLKVVGKIPGVVRHTVIRNVRFDNGSRMITTTGCLLLKFRTRLCLGSSAVLKTCVQKQDIIKFLIVLTTTKP